MTGPDESLDKFRRFLAGRSGEETRGDALFGEIALTMRYVTLEQVEECLGLQDKFRDAGERVLLGQILLSRGYVTTPRFLRLLALTQAQSPAETSHDLDPKIDAPR